MIVTTTHTIEKKEITEYLGIVTGETIFGANIVKDIFASVRDIVGGRSGTYENTIRDARETSTKEMLEAAKRLGADAVIGVDFDYETIGTMLMVTASGTAVKLK
jgi:uncharacterized protein YbjQ (UPF0145 family)